MCVCYNNHPHSVFNYALFWMDSFLIQDEKTLLTYRVGRATNEKTCVHYVYTLYP